jgi:hypothetical protein
MKILRGCRREHAKKKIKTVYNRDATGSNMVMGYSWMDDHTFQLYPHSAL